MNNENVLTRGDLGIDSVSMSQEVSRSHSTKQETSCIEEYGGLTSLGRAERFLVSEFDKEAIRQPADSSLILG